jgi:manganese oxidase
MPLPENTLPMMAGTGPYGGIEMGGMFTVMKIRADLAHNDYRDPGWYKAPAGSVAYPWQGEPPPVQRGGDAIDKSGT